MSVAIKRYANFINGEPAESASGEVDEIINPATGEVIAEVPRSTAEDVDRAVQAAEKAFFEGGWRETTPAERFELLNKLADAIDEHRDELGELESLNVGKPLEAAKEEMDGASDCYRFMAGAARVPEGQAAAEYVRGSTSMIRREPIGVCGGITPWNYPLMMAAWKLAPALAAGNTVVLKPSEITPLTTLRLAEIAADILPPGVLNIVAGHGEPVGAAIASHDRVRFISITGSVASGRKVAQAAAGNLKRVHLELGGKAPVIVFDDADYEAVAETLKFASYWNSGQDCTAATRVIAGPKIYDNLLGSLIEQVETIKVGDPSESDDVDMGPVVSQRQQERVMGFLERATSNGASVATGGETIGDRGFYIKPTVVTGADQRSEIIQNEIFGPVVTVQRFSDDDEAIRWANDVDYGLAASVWTESARRGLNAVRRLQFGAVWLNDHFTVFNEMPHGGFKQSGYGKDMSKYGLDDYTIVKHVLAKFER
ncbi:MAG: aminobutyraldehyde dehydrogenase [Gaiellales bacterium]|jgi:1-pyrroline dehydrogenase|nr:aminobutyraldehyde dehydrogenase [Gaiellales bacterium]